MTYRQQMEKSIKGYMASVGFKYDSKLHTFAREADEDIVFHIDYAAANFNLKEYYELSIYANVIYKSWNELLVELTEERLDLSRTCTGVVSFPAGDKKEPFLFTGKHTLEENIQSFRHELETYVFPVFERYADKKNLYEDMSKRECAYAFTATKRYFLPIACYMFGDYEDSLSHAKRFLQESKDNLQRVPDSPGFRNILDTYQIYYKNLGALIQKRQNK